MKLKFCRYCQNLWELWRWLEQKYYLDAWTSSVVASVWLVCCISQAWVVMMTILLVMMKTMKKMMMIHKGRKIISTMIVNKNIMLVNNLQAIQCELLVPTVQQTQSHTFKSSSSSSSKSSSSSTTSIFKLSSSSSNSIECNSSHTAWIYKQYRSVPSWICELSRKAFPR